MQPSSRTLWHGIGAGLFLFAASTYLPRATATPRQPAQQSVRNGFLTPLSRDVISTVGTFLTVAAVSFAIYQAYKARTESTRAAKATENALNNVNLHATASARRFVDSLKTAIHHEEWLLAAQRSGDIANEVYQISTVSGRGDDWTRLAVELRAWETTFERISRGERRFAGQIVKKWDEFVRDTLPQLDENYNPWANARETTR